MILQRLAEHYDRMVAEGSVTLAAPGFSMQKISFCIVLNPDGSLNQFESLLRPEGKRQIAQTLIVPGQSKPPGQGINPCLLWDNAEYLLGYTQDPLRKSRAALSFQASSEMHQNLEKSVHHPSYTAVCRFLQSWSQDRAEEHPELEGLVSNFGVFRIAGMPQFVHQQISLPDSVEKTESEDDRDIMCLITGSMGQSARLHEPKIKGVMGAQSSGALLVSFNASAFTSYGKEQSFNAPVGPTAVFKYANALNHLLNVRSVRLGDASIVYWADHDTPVEDAFGFVFAGGKDNKLGIQEDAMRVNEARLLLSQLRYGAQTTPFQPEDVPTKFFILGLSPNASRLSVRLWVEADANEMLDRLQQHVQDFALSGDRDDLPPSLWRLAIATGRAEYDPTGRLKGYDSDSVSPQLAGELARSVITGSPYPQSLLAAMARRIQADGEISFVRVSAIKACLVRNTRNTAKPLEVPMKLDIDSSDTAYRCGRLFALLEKAQSDSAGGDLNVTIKDRYFSAASVTPALIFPRLCRLNTHHLNKLEIGSKIYYERLIGSTMVAPFAFPRQLSLMDQGKFIVGYFQQRQDLYASRKDKNTEEAA